MKKHYIKEFFYNWEKLSYEVEYINWKIWLNYLWDYKWFKNEKELEEFLNSEDAKKSAYDFINYEIKEKWFTSKSFLSLDKEDRESMQSITDLWLNVLEIEKLTSQKRTDDKKQVTFRLSTSDIEKIKKMAEDEWIPYQTLIWAIIHKIANSKIELVLK